MGFVAPYVSMSSETSEWGIFATLWCFYPWLFYPDRVSRVSLLISQRYTNQPLSTIDLSSIVYDLEAIYLI